MMNQAEVITAAPPIGMLRNAKNKIQIRRWTKSRISITLVFFTLIFLTLYKLFTMEYGTIVLAEAVITFVTDIGRMFLQPRLSGRFNIWLMFHALGVTVGLSVITTFISALTAFFFSLMAARNLGNPALSQAVRVFMSFIRAVPTILWVLIFSIVAGLGAEAAVVGMCFHGVAYLTKAYSESIEEMDQGTIEALKATGASWWQIVFQAVLPSTVTALLSWTFIRFEINFTNAIAVGAAAGAGGIGFQLFMVSGFYHDLHEMGVIVYMALAVAAVLEVFSMKLRAAYLVQS